MKTKDRFDEHGWLKKEFLWPLRQQITLNSVYFSDYRNSFGIDEHKVYDFFDGYVSFLTELEVEQYGKKLDNISDFFNKFDNEENLKRWYDGFVCFNPLPPKMVNVDIHWDFVRSIQVIASDKDEAIEIVEEMMQNREIPKETFEDGDYWELDTTYQPD